MITPQLATITPGMGADPMVSFYASKDLTALSKKDPSVIAGQFEAMFYRMLMEQQHDEDADDPLLGSSQGQQIQAMWHDELSTSLGKQGKLGIKDMILKYIERAQGVNGGPAGLLKKA